MVAALKSYPDKPVIGRVESIAWGIAQQDGSTGFQLLPSISPTFEWIRLAQRLPVRVRITEVPEGVVLRVGTTCSVLVETGTAGGDGDDSDASATPVPRALRGYRTTRSRRKAMTSIQQTRTMSMLIMALACWLFPLLRTHSAKSCAWIEAINQGLEANQALVAARQSLDAQQKDLAIARSTMLPDLFFLGQGQASKETTFSSSGGVIPEQTVLAGGQISETLYNQSFIDSLGGQKHLYASQQETFEDTRNQTIAEVGQSYVGVLLAAALMGLQYENVTLSQQSLDLAEAQEQSGEVPYGDIALRTKSQLYGTMQQVVAQKSSLLQSRFAFNQVRNRPAEENCELEPLNVERNGFVFSSGVVAEALADDTKASLLRDYLVELGLDRSRSLKSLDAEILGAAKDDEIGPTLVDSKSRCDFLRSDLSQNQPRRVGGDEGRRLYLARCVDAQLERPRRRCLHREDESEQGGVLELELATEQLGDGSRGEHPWHRRDGHCRIRADSARGLAGRDRGRELRLGGERSVSRRGVDAARPD